MLILWLSAGVLELCYLKMGHNSSKMIKTSSSALQALHPYILTLKQNIIFRCKFKVFQ